MFQDLRFAVRSLSRNPVFALGAIATLALGIGVNATIFTLANGALFRHLPGIASPAQLTWVASVWKDRGRTAGMSYPDYLDYREASRDVFADMMAFWPTPLSLGSSGEPERLRGHLVTGSYFPTLGVVPAHGRLLGPADDRRGAVQQVAVVSHGLWQRRFGGAPDVVQQSITVNGRQFGVIGVAPEGFSGPSLGEAADLWLPIALQPELFASQRAQLDNRASSWLSVMGRLQPGLTARRAQASLTAVAVRLAQAYPDADGNRAVSVSGAGSALSPEGRGEMVPLTALLMIVASLILLIACANIANLLLARGAGRSMELGIRAAIGATRGRLLRQLMIESVVLAGSGAFAGLLVSFWASDMLVAMLPAAEFQGLATTADGRVLLFTGLAAGASVCAFGLLPALAATRGALSPSLRQTASAGGGRTRLQGLFVIAQLSLSLVLLLGAGLSLRALQKAASLDLGFNPRHVLTVSYDLVLQNYPQDRRSLFRRDLLARVRGLPEVVSASLANLPPLSGTMVGTIVSSSDDGGGMIESQAYLNAVGAQYFATLEIPLLRGRAIAEEDARTSAGVAIVNETLARRLWSAGDPVGRRVRLGDETLDIVGLARNSKYDEAVEDPRPFLYVALAQRSPLDRESLMVRTAGDPSAAASAVQAAIRALDPVLPVFDVQSLEGLLHLRTDKQRAFSALFAAFGVLALLLAALGLYGVMAYAVTRRTREMGVRLALGASPAQLTALVARDGLRLALIGVGVGSALGLPLANVLGALVFGIQIGDFAAYAAACVLLVGVALAASFLPARRAARLDPMIALRSE